MSVAWDTQEAQEGAEAAIADSHDQKPQEVKSVQLFLPDA